MRSFSFWFSLPLVPNFWSFLYLGRTTLFFGGVGVRNLMKPSLLLAATAAQEANLSVCASVHT